jgi:hypothetical protein
MSRWREEKESATRRMQAKGARFILDLENTLFEQGSPPNPIQSNPRKRARITHQHLLK